MLVQVEEGMTSPMLFIGEMFDVIVLADYPTICKDGTWTEPNKPFDVDLTTLLFYPFTGIASSMLRKNYLRRHL